MTETHAQHERPQPATEVSIGQHFPIFDKPDVAVSKPKGYYEAIDQRYLLKLPPGFIVPEMNVSLSLAPTDFSDYAFVPDDPRRGMQILADDYRRAIKPARTIQIGGDRSSLRSDPDYPYTLGARYKFNIDEAVDGSIENALKKRELELNPLMSHLSLRVFFPEVYEGRFEPDEYLVEENVGSFHVSSFWPSEAPPAAKVIGNGEPELYNLFFPKELKKIQEVKAAFVLPAALMPQDLG